MTLDSLKIIEILGLFFGTSYVIGAILEKRWCWYAGIISTILYAISVFYYNLYGEFILQFFYLGMSLYGLMKWKKSTPKNNNQILENSPDLSPSYSPKGFLLYNILTGSILSFIFYYVLLYFNGSYPFLDALTSGFGISTTYLTAKKKIENWVFWILIDITLAIILYLKEMPFYSILYILYTLFAILGFYQWHREYVNKKVLL